MSKKTAFSSDCEKYWTVTTNKKVTFYGETRCIGVVAKSARSAEKKVSDTYPDEVVVSINHVGAVDLI